ncbi:hypothetical protein HanRHA438_Chr01g0009841 [Helianthus annuus]|nr:hypothetical protein HanRHA438_Chr01g0009841 [Helianthus annuus]
MKTRNQAKRKNQSTGAEEVGRDSSAHDPKANAVTSGNYVSFFKLYKNAPNLNTCLMDLYVVMVTSRTSH